MAPVELFTSPDKGKLFRTCMVPMLKALEAAIQTIQNSSFRNNNFFYNSLKKGYRSDPQENDICMILGQGLNSENRFGMIIKVNKTSVTVKFPNGHVQDYANKMVVLLVRPARSSTEELDQN